MLNAYEEELRVLEIRAARKEGMTEFWRQDEPELQEGPDGKELIKGGMTGPQRSFWGLKNRIKALIGGYGSGKTITLCKWAIASALHNAPAPVAVVSPTYTMASETTITTLQTLLAGKQSLLGAAFDWKYNGSSHKFNVNYHGREGRILIYSGDNPVRLKGPNIGAVGIDEPFIQEYGVFQQMLARLRHPQSRVREMVLTGTPEQLNWGYDLFKGDLKEKHDVGYVIAPTKSNIVLPGDYIQALEDSFDEKTRQAYLDGLFVNLSTGLVFYGFDPEVNVVDLPEVQENCEYGFGMDFNVNPLACNVFWKTGAGHMHIFAEYEFPNADTEYACSVLREKYGEKLRTAYPDPSGNARHTNSPAGKTDFHFIRQAGFEIRARHNGEPTNRDAENAVNTKMKNRRKIDGKEYPTLTISPKCKKLIKYLSLFSHELKNKDEQKAMGHLLDSMKYPIEYQFPAKKPVLGTRSLTGH